MGSANESFIAEVRTKVWFLEEFQKGFTYVSMIRENFGFTHLIPGIENIIDVHDMLFWDTALKNVSALKKELKTVVCDSGFDEEKDVWGSTADDVVVVTEYVLSLCELECHLNMVEKTLF